MIAGVYRAVVQDVRDPSGRGRIKVTIPSVSGNSPTDWLWPVINCGYSVTPEPGEQVWVMFEAGDEDNPVWIGSTKVHPDYHDLVDRVTALEQALQSHTH